MANNDMLGMLKGLLGDNADEKINAAINVLKNTSQSDNILNTDYSDTDNSSIDDSPLPVSSDINTGKLFSAEGLEYMTKIKGIIDEMGSANDPRSNLLMSLRPYMRSNRQKSIDNAVRLLNLSRFSGLFKI